MRTKATLTALLLLAALLAGCTSGEGPLPETEGSGTESTLQTPSGETGPGTDDVMDNADAAGNDGQNGMTGGEDIAAIQHPKDGLQHIYAEHKYYQTLSGQPDFDNPENEVMKLVYLEDDGSETTLIDGLRGYANVYTGPDGRLYYNSFDGGIQILNETEGALAPWAKMEGHSFGPEWYGDSEYLYTTAHILRTEESKEQDQQLVRVSWADGTAEILPETTGLHINDVYGQTLLGLYWDHETDETTLTTLDLASGEKQSAKFLEKEFGDLCRGVYYTFETGADGIATMRGKNLTTSEEATATFVQPEAELWLVEGIRNNQLYVVGVGGGDAPGFHYYYIDLATGEYTTETIYYH